MKSLFFIILSLYLFSVLADQTNQTDKMTNDGTFPNTAFQYYSGYLNITSNKSFHYLFFESNTKTNLTDPLVLWLNGGPGCSSLLGAFQENGPFLFNINVTGLNRTLNQYSWNNFANVLYIESPAGVLNFVNLYIIHS